MIALHYAFKPRNRIVFALCQLAIAAPAIAGSFSITPLRAEFSDRKRIEAFTIRNEENNAVVVQTSVQTWTQVDGQDELTPTRDALATPAVFTIPAKGQQILRLALRRDPDSERELTYRVVLQEVPNATPSDFNGLRVSLRLTLPIFVAPSAKASISLHKALAWRAARRDGKLFIAASNSSNEHIQIFDCTASFDDATEPTRNSVGKHVLAGAHIEWAMQMPQDINRDAAFKLSCLTDQGEVDTELPVPQ